MFAPNCPEKWLATSDQNALAPTSGTGEEDLWLFMIVHMHARGPPFPGFYPKNFLNGMLPSILMNCAICKAKISSTFLGKIIGAYVKDAKGKTRTICPQCQKRYPAKSDIIVHL